MSVLIKGMEISKSCCDCKFVQKGSQEFCGLLLPDFKYSENWARRPTFCPLVGIPPHGRLIDADALAKSIKDQIELIKLFRNEELDRVAQIIEVGYLQEIANAPTILEAEVEER